MDPAGGGLRSSSKESRESSSRVPWEVTEEKIQQVLNRILQASERRRVILFGSSARGAVTANSDADFLVVVPDGTESTLREAQRLHLAAAEIPRPKDFVMVREGTLRRLANRWDLVYYHALREGRALYEAAGGHGPQSR